MKQQKPILHGRDHCPGGADPIPCLGTGGGPDYPTTVAGITDLIAYWRMGEGASPFADTSGYFGTSGAAVEMQVQMGGGGPPNQPMNKAATGALDVNDDGAVEFLRNMAGGGAEYLEAYFLPGGVGDARFNFGPNGPYTLACYVKPYASTSGTWRASFVNNLFFHPGGLPSSQYDDGFRLDISYPSLLLGWTRAGQVHAAETPVTVTHTLTADTWYHVVGTYDGTSLQLWIDGVSIGTATDTNAMDASHNRGVTIGSVSQHVSNSEGGWCYGSVDEVALWKRALTTTEIAALFAAGVSGGNQEQGKVLTADGSGGSSYRYPTVKVDGTRYDEILAGTNLTSTDNTDGTVTLDATGGGGAIAINAQTGTTYTLVLSDAEKLVTLSNASAITLTVPTNASVTYPTGTQILLGQLGAGQVTVAGASGVTVSSRGAALKIAGQYGAATLIKIATDTWLLSGDVTT